MKRWKKGAAVAIVVLLLATAGLLALVYASMQPTTGAKIATYPSPRTALLLVDIQEDYTGPQARKPYREGAKIIAASNALLAQAEPKDLVVIYIENVVKNPIQSLLMGGINAPGAPGTALDRRITRIPGARTFAKNQSDAFATAELDAYLREQQVHHLVITGLDAAYCVKATVQGALNRGYKVTIPARGIATESSTPVETLLRDWQRAGVQVLTGTDL